jgi:uncharacterized protein (DUF427 family)
VSLTTGRGPLGPDPAGRFSAPLPDRVVYVEPYLRRIRAVLGDKTVIDTEGALLVHRPGRAPSFAFPPADVGGIANEPEPAADGYVTVAWDLPDAWLEEDEPLHGHPRNPYHRVDSLPTSRRLRVEVGGEVLVDTTDTVFVAETSLAPKLYVHRDHVRMDLLEPSDTTTYCPYKGTASYWSARVGGEMVADVAWSYEDPLPESLPLAGLLSFDPARATVDAQLPPPASVRRPITPA